MSLVLSLGADSLPAVKGTLRQKRPGYWEMRVEAGADPVTRRRRQLSRGFRGTKKEAERALRDFAREVDAGRHGGTDQTVAALLKEWVSHAGPSWSPTTRERNRQVIEGHILPAIGAKSLARLRARDLDRLYDRMTAAGSASGTVRKAHAIIHRALRQAKKWEWVAENVADDASPPVVHQQEIRSPTPAQVRAVMAEAARFPGFPMFLRLAATTGARRGEVCGLRWSDIDLAVCALRINRAVIQVGGAITIKDVKTHQGRTVALDDETAAELAAHGERMRARAAAAGVQLVADPFLFSEPARSLMLDGSEPWRPSEASRRWSRVRAAAGVPGLKLHSLRHFTATQALDAGVPLRTVSARLGHRRTSTTSDIYAGFIPASDRLAADAMGDRLRRPEHDEPDTA